MDKHAFIDVESCGLVGMPVLFQYAIDDGSIELFDIWDRPIYEFLELIQELTQHTAVMFNACFDLFQIQKAYCLFNEVDPNWIPREHINEIAEIEPQAIYGPCVKFDKVLDLWLYSKRGPLQSLMRRKPIRIRRIPVEMAEMLCEELTQRVTFDDIFFAKSRDPAHRWTIYPIEDDEDFVDVGLSFNPAMGLKFLAQYVLKKDVELHFSDVEVPVEFRPIEFEYNPVSAKADPEKAWPQMLPFHIDHWRSNQNARTYAAADITYLRDLWYHFDRPRGGDVNSELCGMVASSRWRGFRINTEGIRQLLTEAEAVVAASPINTNSSNEVREYIESAMDEYSKALLEEEKASSFGKIAKTTQAAVLKEIVTIWGKDSDLGARCDEVLKVKKAVKEVQLFDKLLSTGRLHPDFSVIGAKSSRMSGRGGLSAHGINSNKNVRRQFPLKDEHENLSIGDFASFEVTIADAIYDDPDLHRTLTEAVSCELCKGTNPECYVCGGTGQHIKKLHGIFATLLFPGIDYYEALSEEYEEEYGKAKSGVFALQYAGDEGTLNRNLGIPKEQCQAAMIAWARIFPGMANAQLATKEAFACMSQPDGIGSAIHWKDPEDYVDTMFGFKRYFTLENATIKALFNLAQAPPKRFKDMKMKVARRDRVQSAAGATSSALFGAAFGMQGANQRAAINHKIQSPGADITKETQAEIWKLQPAGIHEFRVRGANVHDEIFAISPPELADEIDRVVQTKVESFRDKVRLIKIEWQKDGSSWASK